MSGDAKNLDEAGDELMAAAEEVRRAAAERAAGGHPASDSSLTELPLTPEDEEIVENQEEIISEMDEVREKLGDGIDRLGESMRNVFDWQAYVKSAPLTSVGIAAAVGFLLTPAIRSRPASTPFVPVPVNPTSVPAAAAGGGIFDSLASMAFAAVSRIASGYLMELFTSQTTPMAGNTSTPGHQPTHGYPPIPDYDSDAGFRNPSNQT